MMEGIVTNKIEIRQLNENNNPRYVVNGTAIVAGKKYPREWVTDKSGKTIKVAKEMFTPHFIKSLKEQAKHKNIFVDVQHELVREASINAIAKGKLSKDEEESIANMVSKKMLPLAKCSDIDIEGDSLKVYTELNTMFPTVNDLHKKVFDATWYSLENGFLNGISLNFDNWQFTHDEHGDVVVDDADLLGISYVSGASNYLHSIDEVAIRQFEKTIQIREGERKMENENKQIEEARAKLESDKAAFEAQKIESARQTEIAKQKDVQAKIESELAAKTEEAKKAVEDKNKMAEELNRAKGKVPFNRNLQNLGTPAINPEEAKIYEENLGAIMANHNRTMGSLRQGKQPMEDHTMKGFSELVNLSVGLSPTAGMSKKDELYLTEFAPGLLAKGPGDIVLPRQ